MEQFASFFHPLYQHRRHQKQPNGTTLFWKPKSWFPNLFRALSEILCTTVEYGRLRILFVAIAAKKKRRIGGGAHAVGSQTALQEMKRPLP
jgi:hypothetical protein